MREFTWSRNELEINGDHITLQKLTGRWGPAVQIVVGNGCEDGVLTLPTREAAAHFLAFLNTQLIKTVQELDLPD